MAIKSFTGLAKTAFSPLSKPKDEEIIRLNCYKMSLRGTLACGSTALVSFIFNRFLAQEGAWKALAPYVFKTSLMSCAIFAVVGIYSFYKILTDEIDVDESFAKAFNDRVSLIAKGSTLFGLIGATAAWAAQSATSNLQVSSLAKHSFSPLLGLGIAGSVLFVFHNRQQTQMGGKS